MSNPTRPLPITRVSSLSSRYVKVPVNALNNGVIVDPSADAVAFAFKTPGTDPVPADFHAGTWETLNPLGAGMPYAARLLVGPQGTALAKATYTIWLKITDNPELPCDPVGTLVVF